MAGINSTLLNQYFTYKNGLLIRNITTSSKAIVGSEIKGLDKEGYVRVSIHNKNYRVHRLIYMMFYGYMPKRIDHVNGVVNDNRIENLRKATKEQNGWNRGIQKNNKSGIKNL